MSNLIEAPSGLYGNAINRAQGFIKKFELHYLVRIDWMQHGNQFHHWFSKLLNGVARPTAIRYRQWMSAYLILINELDMADIISHIGRIEKKRSYVKNEKGLSASAIKTEDFSKVIKALMETKKNGEFRYKIGELAAMWIFAGAMTGIRPSEWATVKIINNYIDCSGVAYNRIIQVTSAKKGGLAKRYSEQKRGIM